MKVATIYLGVFADESRYGKFKDQIIQDIQNEHTRKNARRLVREWNSDKRVSRFRVVKAILTVKIVKGS